MANEVHLPATASIGTAGAGCQANSTSGSVDSANRSQVPLEPLAVAPTAFSDDSSVLDMLDLLDMTDPEAAADVFAAEGLLTDPCDSLAGFGNPADAGNGGRCILPPGVVASRVTEADAHALASVTSSGDCRLGGNQHNFGSTAAFTGRLPADTGGVLRPLRVADSRPGVVVSAVGSMPAGEKSVHPHCSPAVGRRRQAGLPEAAGQPVAAATGAARGFTLECTVCGDRARGYNFGAVACESCKAFFRRTVLRNKPVACQFAGNCVQTVKTRKFCPACRLDKCLAVGMNKRLVRGDEEKKQRSEARHVQDRKKKVPPRATSAMTNRRRRASAIAAPDDAREEEEEEEDNDGATAGLSPSSSSAVAVSSTGIPLTGDQGSPACMDVMLGDGSGCSLSGLQKLQSDGSQGGAVVVALLSPTSAPAALGSCLVSPLAHQCGDLASRFEPASVSELSTPNMSSAIVDEKVDISYCFGNSDNDSNTAEVPPCCSARVPSQSMHSLVRSALDELRIGRRHTASELPRQLPKPEDPSQQRRLPALKWAELDSLGRLYSTRDGYDKTLSSIHEDSFAEGRGRPMSAAVGATAQYSLDFIAQQTNAFIRRMVAFARELPEFCALPLNLQMHMLKASAGSFITVRSAEVYNPDVGCFFDEQGCKINTDVMGSVGTGSPEAANWRVLHSELMESIRRLLPIDSDGRCDIVIVALLHTIVLLSPEYFSGGSGPKVFDCTAVLADVSDAQQRYIMLLRHYIEAKYSYAAAAELVPELIRLLSLCKRTANMLSAVLLEVEPFRDDPLLHEILEPSPAAS